MFASSWVFSYFYLYLILGTIILIKKKLLKDILKQLNGVICDIFRGKESMKLHMCIYIYVQFYKRLIEFYISTFMALCIYRTNICICKYIYTQIHILISLTYNLGGIPIPIKILIFCWHSFINKLFLESFFNEGFCSQNKFVPNCPVL